MKVHFINLSENVKKKNVSDNNHFHGNKITLKQDLTKENTTQCSACQTRSIITVKDQYSMTACGYIYNRRGKPKGVHQNLNKMEEKGNFVHCKTKVHVLYICKI